MPSSVTRLFALFLILGVALGATEPSESGSWPNSREARKESTHGARVVDAERTKIAKKGER